MRTIKDSVFRDLFSQPEYLLQLYQTLHPEDTAATEAALGNVTIRNIFTEQLYNDLGFTVGDRILVLVEAQSTWTVNVAFRILMYWAETLNRYFQKTEQDTYHNPKVSAPVPEFYVLYTGSRQSRPDWIRMEDEFFGGNGTFCTLHVRMLYGDGEDDILTQYVMFTKIYNEQLRLYGRTLKAIQETIRICRDRNILKAYLQAREPEVITIMQTLFSQEQVTKMYGRRRWREGRAEGLAEGKAEGRAEGRAEGEQHNAKKNAFRMRDRGVDNSTIADFLDISEEQLSAWFAEGPDTEETEE